MTKSRPAEARDLRAILRLIRHARSAIRALGIDQWQDGYPEPEVIEGDILRGAGRVFERDGEIAGYMVPLPGIEPAYAHIDGAWLCDGPYLTVHRMAIDDAWRGSGLSVEMLESAEALARECGAASVRADTHRGNRAMRGLLEKCGYACCGEVAYDVTAGDPIRVAYEKRLEDR